MAAEAARSANVDNADHGIRSGSIRSPLTNSTELDIADIQ
jgi:hypothetical protein